MSSRLLHGTFLYSLNLSLCSLNFLKPPGLYQILQDFLTTLPDMFQAVFEALLDYFKTMPGLLKILRLFQAYIQNW